MGEPLKNSADEPYVVTASLIREWWSSLQESNQAGTRAALRRARTPNEISVQYEYFNLFRKLTDSKLPDFIKKRLSYRLPLVAGILSHIREDEPSRPAAARMGSSDKPGGDRPLVSDLRFRRLLRTEDDNELFLMMIRMIRMLGDRVNVKDTAMSVFFWNEQTRKKWASLYYLKRDIYSIQEVSENNSTKKGEEK